MLARLGGLGVVPAGLDRIRDLAVTFTPPDDLEIAFTQQASAVAEQIQLWQEGASDRGPWLDLAGPDTLTSVQEGTVQNCRVRGVNVGGEVGPASNVARFDVSLSGVGINGLHRDAKIASYLGNSAGNLGVNLDSMTGGALTRSVGDLLVIISHIHTAISTPLPTQMTLPAGWTEASFVAAGSSEVWGYRSAYKVCDGTETVVPMIDSVGATANQRVNYHAYSFPFTGILELGDPVPAAIAINGDPPSRTLETEKEGTDAVLAFASQAGTTSLNIVGFSSGWTVMPSHNSPQDLSATTTCRSRAIYRIFPAPSTKLDMVINCGNNGLNSCGFFYFVFRGG